MKTSKNETRTLDSATHKLLVRGGLEGHTTLIRDYKCPYGSWDRLYDFELRASDPQQAREDGHHSAESVRVYGNICLHRVSKWSNPQDMMGKLSAGVGANTDPIQNDPLSREERAAANILHDEEYRSMITIEWFEPSTGTNYSRMITFTELYRLEGVNDDAVKAVRNILKAVTRLWAEYMFDLTAVEQTPRG